MSEEKKTEDKNVVSEENIQKVSGGALSDINPSDIEAMTVLKDASSTAIHGNARPMNENSPLFVVDGVVLQ